MESEMSNNSILYLFDFEIGHLVRSPCKTCINLEDLPTCFAGCDMLDKIQTILSQAISTSTCTS